MGTCVVSDQGGEGNWGGGSRAWNDWAFGFYGSSVDPAVATEGSSAFVSGGGVGPFLRWCGSISVASQCGGRSVILL